MTQNMVWLDLEMTGLNPEADQIMEMGVIITDDDFKIVEELEIVINQPDSVLDGMNDWCKKQHSKTGLTESCRNSKISLGQAEKQVFNLIKKHCKQGEGVLAGNSVWVDRLFLMRYMPALVEYLHYRIIDVSTVKELVRRWYGEDKLLTKKEGHRALEDIHESIEELKYYKKDFFK